MARTKTKPGPKIETFEAKRRAKLSLAGMYPTALRNISKALNDPERPDIDSSWRVVEHRDGKPMQRNATELSGEIILRVVYDGSEESQEGSST